MRDEAISGMRTSPLRVIRTVASALLGVRSRSDSDRDLEKVSIRQIVIAAVVMMALFVTTILLVVRTVVG